MDIEGEWLLDIWQVEGWGLEECLLKASERGVNRGK
jgi:hypothetical protein